MAEMTPDHPTNDTDAELEAVRDMMAAVLVIAIKHRVCPVCLTLMTAQTVEDGVDSGQLAHGIPGDDDLENLPTVGGMQ